MRKVLAAFIVTVFLGSVQIHSTLLTKAKAFNYPNVRRDENIIDDYHGTKIADPYRWLENPDSEETKLFIEGENNLTNSYIQDNPLREDIKKRLAEIMNYEKFSCPYIAGGKYYYSKNSGLQDQDAFYVQDSLNAEPKVFIDPNTFSEDGTAVIAGKFFSEDGEMFAYGIQEKGSDWITLHFKNATSMKDLPDKLQYLKFADVEWDKENTGVYYARYPEPSGVADGSGTEALEHQKIYYHALGTNQTEDILLVEFPEYPKLTIEFTLSEEKDYMIIMPDKGIGEYLMYYAILDEAKNETTKNDTKLQLYPIVTKFESSFTYITDEEGVFYFTTNKGAANSKVIGIDLNKPEEKYWSTLIPEHETDALYAVSVVNSLYLTVNYIRDVKNVIELRHLSNGSFIKTLTSDEIGLIYDCPFRNREDSEMFYSFTSFLTPDRVYHINFTEDLSDHSETTLWKESKLKGFNAEDYVTTQVFYNSTDGTKIPMYITHRKHLELTGDLPTRLYGYGGYGGSELPAYSSPDLLFIQNFNGVHAVANIRGGGEYGLKWWNEGRLLNKQQSFEDFQSAAEFLIGNNYTNPSKLFIEGGSNGGLLIGACVNQRPELYGAALLDVGILDMLRYQKFTIGYAWCTEFGCSEDKIHFDNLVKYSPLHNIRLPSNESVQYPAILVNTADHDDRVVPLHSYKFISELQYKIGKSDRQTNPLLIRIESSAGHGGGKPISKQIEESTDKFSFLIKTLGYKFHN